MYTHEGGWTSSSRIDPILGFVEKFTDMMKSKEAVSERAWFGPSTKFACGNGSIYGPGGVGGDITKWIRDLFSSMGTVEETGRVRKVTVVKNLKYLKSGRGTLTDSEAEFVDPKKMMKGSLVL